MVVWLSVFLDFWGMEDNCPVGGLKVLYIREMAVQ